MKIEIRTLFVSLTVVIWSVLTLLIPGMMVAFSEEDRDSVNTEGPLLSSASEVSQLFKPGKVAKLVYHTRSYTNNSRGTDYSITYVPQGVLGKKCLYGYTFLEIDADLTLLSGFYVACKKAKDIYIVYELSANPDSQAKVKIMEFKLENDAVYSKTGSSYGSGNYSTPWEVYALSQNQIDHFSQSISSFEESEKDKKRFTSFSKFIAKSFIDSGEKGVKNAIKKSKKYTISVN